MIRMCENTQHVSEIISTLTHAAQNLQHVWFPTNYYLARFFLKKNPSDEQLILKAIIHVLQNQSVSHL